MPISDSKRFDALPRLFVLGASMTIHFGPHLERELAGRFAYDRKRANDGKRAEDNLDIAQGASAGDSGMALAYLQYCANNNPIPSDILLLSCGLHDLKTDPKTGSKQVPPDRFEHNLRAIVQVVASMGPTLVWLRIPPVVDAIHNARSTSFHRFNVDVDQYNRLADGVMRESGVHTIDLHALCSRLVPDALIDHIHYSEFARKQQAEFIARELTAWWESASNTGSR